MSIIALHVSCFPLTTGHVIYRAHHHETRITFPRISSFRRYLLPEMSPRPLSRPTSRRRRAKRRRWGWKGEEKEKVQRAHFLASGKLPISRRLALLRPPRPTIIASSSFLSLRNENVSDGVDYRARSGLVCRGHTHTRRQGGSTHTRVVSTPGVNTLAASIFLRSRIHRVI